MMISGSIHPRPAAGRAVPGRAQARRGVEHRGIEPHGGRAAVLRAQLGKRGDAVIGGEDDDRAVPPDLLVRKLNSRASIRSGRTIMSMISWLSGP